MLLMPYLRKCRGVGLLNSAARFKLQGRRKRSAFRPVTRVSWRFKRDLCRLELTLRAADARRNHQNNRADRRRTHKKPGIWPGSGSKTVSRHQEHFDT